jgi:hypothetical protein
MFQYSVSWGIGALDGTAGQDAQNFGGGGADSPHRSNCAIAKAESQGAQTANPQIWQKNGDLVPRLGVLSVECHQTELAGLALAHRS